MKKLKFAFIWLLLLNKRLCKRAVFPIILLLIPVLVFGYRAAAREDSGVLTVALAREGNDAMAVQLMQDLPQESKLLRYRVYPDPDAARDAVILGRADCAWIFPADLSAQIARYITQPSRDSACIQVFEQESNVLLMLTREKLAGALYKRCSQGIYLNFIRDTLPELSGVSDAELLSFYNSTGISDTLFEFENSSNAGEKTSENYLLSPVRGILAVITVLATVAAAMYYVQDTRLGMLARVPLSLRPLAELSCLFVPAFDMCAASLISLFLAGLAGPVWKELLLLPLYSLSVTLFCMLLRRLCGSVRALAVLLPIVSVALLLVCPVFFNLGFLRSFQYLFPPTYYINAVYQNRFLLLMPLHICAMGLLYFLAGKLPRRE